MASLGMMLAGSSIGQGMGQLVHQQAQGAFDRQRFDQTAAQNDQSQKVWDFQNAEMDRTKQGQGIDSTVTDGATDADRLEQLAEIAGKANRGDLQRKYKAEASKARESQQLMSIANASRAITMGQFEPATQMLNKAGIFGQIHSIKLADDLTDENGNPVPNDPRNPTYSVYSAGAPDANGNPTPGPHVHLSQQMLYAAQAKPGDALHWLSYAQAQGQKADLGERRLDQTDTRLAEAERHNRAMEAAKKMAGGAAGAGGRLTDQRWRYQWATTPAEKGGGGMSAKDAMTWATDPQKDNRAFWQVMKIAGNQPGYVMNNEDRSLAVVNAMKRFAGHILGNSPIKPQAPPAAPATPPKAQAGNRDHIPQGANNPLSKLPGMTPVQGREAEGVYQTPSGLLVKMVAGKAVKWSDTANNWVSAK